MNELEDTHRDRTAIRSWAMEVCRCDHQRAVEVVEAVRDGAAADATVPLAVVVEAAQVPLAKMHREVRRVRGAHGVGDRPGTPRSESEVVDNLGHVVAVRALRPKDAVPEGRAPRED